MRNSSPPRGMTITDVLVAALLLAVAGFVVVPALATQSQENANRIKCSKNLAQILFAMKLYANEQPRTFSFPRTTYRRETAQKPVFYTRPTSPSPLAVSGPLPNDVTAGPWLLIRTQDITPDVFVCPSTRFKPFVFPQGKTALNYSNFESSRRLTYSFQNPYPTQAGIDLGFAYNDAMDADFAVAADLNPGGHALLTTQRSAGVAEQLKLNSPNHGQAGQNVGYADGHVAWKTRAWAGHPMPDRVSDNIYTCRAAKNGVLPVHPAGIIGPPGGAGDSVLLPTWDDAIAYPIIDR